MLRWRLILGVGITAALAGLCWIDAQGPFPAEGQAWAGPRYQPGMCLAAIALILAALATGEMRRLFSHNGIELSARSLYVATLLPVAASSLPIVVPNVVFNFSLGSAGWLAIGLAFGLMAALVGEMRRYETPGQSIANAAYASLSVLYVGGLIGMLVQLRLERSPGYIGGWRGLLPLLTLIATVKLSDIGQYVFGRLFGRRKLAPRLSPGKTWEGAVGGILLASVVSTAAIAWITQGDAGFRPAHVLLAWCYALSVSVAGIMGDLAESLLKRDAGLKDSSDWLPGFGGVLDLLDSILFAAPVGYLWAVIGLLSV